jgi:multidrug/hemolysin transport system permease protein
VFLSFLGAIILLFLYVLFLQRLNVDGIKSYLNGYRVAYEVPAVSYLVSVWVYAGLILVTCITTGFGALVGYVDDRVSGRFAEFVVMPVKRWQIMAAYYVNSVFAAMLVSTAIILLGWGVVRLVAGQAPTPVQVGQAWLWAVFCSLAFSALSLFLVSLASSLSAFVTESTIIGGLIGFVTAAYLPENMIPDRVRDVINVLPFVQGAALIRDPLVTDAVAQVAGPEGVYNDFLSSAYGLRLELGSTVLPEWTPIASLIGLVVVFGPLSVLMLRRKIK